MGFPCLFGDILGWPLISKVIPWTVKVRRGVTRPTAAARQPGTRIWMKRMAWVPLKGYPRISQSRIIILTYPGLYKTNYKSGHLIPTYPSPEICKSRHLQVFPIYPGLSQSTKPIPGYPGFKLSWLAQGVAFQMWVVTRPRNAFNFFVVPVHNLVESKKEEFHA